MNKKTKLLLISPTPPPYGGIANWSLMIIDEIKKNHKEITLEHLNISPNKSFAEGRNLKNRIFDSGMAMLSLRRVLIKKIKESKTDIVHLTTSGQLAVIRDILFMKVLKKYKIPVVYHLHFGRVPELIEQNNIEWKFLKYSLRLSNVIICIDNRTYDYLNKDPLFKGKVKLIPNPIKPLRQIPTVNNKKIIYLGHVLFTKGIEELIDAFNYIKDSYDWELEIIGPYSKEYFDFLSTKDLSKVNFLGEMNHRDALLELGRGGIFVLPSHTEGFPNVVLEAMQLKKPIIATNVGAIPEMLELNCGFLVEPKNVIQLKNGLIKLIEDEKLRHSLASNAFKKSNNEYLLNIVIKQYIEIWKK